jgi:hypothetical protein
MFVCQLTSNFLIRDIFSLALRRSHVRVRRITAPCNTHHVLIVTPTIPSGGRACGILHKDAALIVAPRWVDISKVEQLPRGRIAVAPLPLRT